MARMSKIDKVKAEIAAIRAQLAKATSKAINQEEQADEIVEAQKDIIIKKAVPAAVEETHTRSRAKREIIVPVAEVAHVRGEKCRIAERRVKCKKCHHKFLSGGADIYASNIQHRVVCVCPSCLTENLIKSEPHFAGERVDALE